MASIGKTVGDAKPATWPLSVWYLSLLFIVVGALAIEALPAVFGTGFGATWDWSFPYVTMRFILLPAVSLLVLGSALVLSAIRRGSVPLVAWLAAAAASLYLGMLWYRPTLWFA